MTNPEYVLEFMQDNGYPYFVITNGSNRPIVTSFNDRSLGQGVEALRKYFANNTGFMRCYLYETNEFKGNSKEPKSPPQIFEITLTGNESKDQGVGNVNLPPVSVQSPNNGIIGIETYLGKHEENSSLKEKLARLELEIEMMRKDHERELRLLTEKHEADIKAAKDGNQMITQGLGMLMQHMGVNS